MIREISSDLASFKTLRFRDGLNILLAEKSPGATDRQSRNSAGKSSVVEIVHFLLGGKADPNSIFRSDALGASCFRLEVDLAAAPVLISRSGGLAAKGKKQSKGAQDITVIGNLSKWLRNVPNSDVETVLSNEQWKAVLADA